MDYDHNGWTYSDKLLCWRCVHNDEYLKEVLRAAGDVDGICSYCGEPGASSLETMLELVTVAVGNSWQDADEYPGTYSSADGGYQFPTTELSDIHYELLYDYFVDDQIVEDIVQSFDIRLMASQDDPGDWFTSDNWEGFSELVQHRTRYMFWTDSDSFDGSDGYWFGERPLSALEFLAQRLNDHGMLNTIASGEGLWRAQGHCGPELDGGVGARRLGTVPVHLASAPNRMSAPGIPMFYGALDSETAVVEATRHGDPNWDHATVGRFEPSRDLVVLDLRRLAVPDEPSVFIPAGDERVTQYSDAKFLERFVDTVRRPVDEDTARRGIEYVPTQVFTEFVLHAMGSMVEPKQQIDGIVYPSAELAGGANIVLDLPNRLCVDRASNFARDGRRLELVLDSASVSVARRSWKFGDEPARGPDVS